MAEIARISVEDLSLTMHNERGQVAGASKWATTEVSGGGGSGYVHNGTGFSSTAPVRSKTTEHDQFFLRTAEGKEIPVRARNMQLALRDGHDLSLFWGIGEGKDTGPYLAMHNHTTDETTWMTKSGGNELFGAGLTIRLVLVFLALVVGVIGLLVSLANMSVIGMAISGVVVWFSWTSTRKMLRKLKRLEAEIKAAVGKTLGRGA